MMIMVATASSAYFAVTQSELRNASGKMLINLICDLQFPMLSALLMLQKGQRFDSQHWLGKTIEMCAFHSHEEN